MQNNNFNCSWFCSQTKVLNKCAYIVHTYIHRALKWKFLNIDFTGFPSVYIDGITHERSYVHAFLAGASDTFQGDFPAWLFVISHFPVPSSQFSILSSEFSVCKSVLAYNKCRHLHLFRTEARERERERER